MEPNKIERVFKEKLDERTIQPSAMAWDRLDAMLSVTEEKKQPKKKYWMYIAASFLGFLLIGALLLKLEGETIPAADKNTNAVVNSTKSVQKTDTNTVIPAAVDVIKEVSAVPVNNETLAVQQDATVKPQTEKPKKIKVQDIDNNMPVTVQNEAVAVQQLERSPQEESETLLASSLAEDTSTKKKSNFKVDANSLLSSVEGELNNNFRNEVLQKVVKNYNTVKTSVANRNYQ